MNGKEDFVKENIERVKRLIGTKFIHHSLILIITDDKTHKSTKEKIKSSLTGHNISFIDLSSSKSVLREVNKLQRKWHESIKNKITEDFIVFSKLEDYLNCPHTFWGKFHIYQFTSENRSSLGKVSE